ncbi:hypothetical protein EJD97_021520, partial [Solanum chilense]
MLGVVNSKEETPTTIPTPPLFIPPLIPIPVESNSHNTTSSPTDVHSNSRDQLLVAAKTSSNTQLSAPSFQFPSPSLL